MRFSALILFMTIMTIILYFLHSPTIIDQLNGSGAGNNGKQIAVNCQANDASCLKLSATNFASADNTWLLGILLITVAAAGILANLLLGFSAIYVLPIVILIGILSFFVMPYGIFLNAAIIPNYLGVPLMFFFNVLVVLAITDFIRGGA